MQIKFRSRIIGINPTQSGTISLYLEVRIDGKRDRIPLDLSVDKKLWNEEDGIVTGEKSTDLNLQLKKYLADATDIIVRHRLSGIPVDSKLFRKEFYNPAGRTCFNQFCEKQREIHKAFIVHGTYTYHKFIHARLKEYQDPLPYAMISDDWCREFDHWLVTKKKLNINTRHKYFKNLNQYMKMAINSGVPVKNFFEMYKISTIKGNKVALSPAQMAALHQYYESNEIPPKQRHVLQYYLFGCYTGLGFSDIRAISRKNIVGNHLIIVRHKTRTRRFQEGRIPLLPEVYDIINEQGPLFDKVYSNATSNKVLKLIAKAVKIYQKLTMHTARHTLGTMLARVGMEPQYIQQFMLHSKIEQSMDYISLSATDLDERAEDIGARITKAIGSHRPSSSA